LIDLVYNEASWVKLLWSRFRPGKRTYQIAYQIFILAECLVDFDNFVLVFLGLSRQEEILVFKWGWGWGWVW
jgi:hypothetical protein